MIMMMMTMMMQMMQVMHIMILLYDDIVYCTILPYNI
jgi:hypothetical protein